MKNMKGFFPKFTDNKVLKFEKIQKRYNVSCAHENWSKLRSRVFATDGPRLKSLYSFKVSPPFRFIAGPTTEHTRNPVVPPRDLTINARVNHHHDMTWVSPATRRTSYDDHMPFGTWYHFIVGDTAPTREPWTVTTVRLSRPPPCGNDWWGTSFQT